MIPYLYHVRVRPEIVQGMVCFMAPYQIGDHRDFICIVTQNRIHAEARAVEFLQENHAESRTLAAEDLGQHWELVE